MAAPTEPPGCVPLCLFGPAKTSLRTRSQNPSKPVSELWRARSREERIRGSQRAAAMDTDTLQKIRYLDEQLSTTELSEAQQELITRHRLVALQQRTVRSCYVLSNVGPNGYCGVCSAKGALEGCHL